MDSCLDRGLNGFGIRVEAERIRERTSRQVMTCCFTMAAVDQAGRPIPIASVHIATPVEKRRWAAAQSRRELRSCPQSGPAGQQGFDKRQKVNLCRNRVVLHSATETLMSALDQRLIRSLVSQLGQMALRPRIIPVIIPTSVFRWRATRSGPEVPSGRVAEALILWHDTSDGCHSW